MTIASSVDKIEPLKEGDDTYHHADAFVLHFGIIYQNALNELPEGKTLTET